jgi:hypothetical protein
MNQAALALLMTGELLVLDEPTNHLDLPPSNARVGAGVVDGTLLRSRTTAGF